jgi:hypothetical protein
MHIADVDGEINMSKHARTTITVPADLKARMEAIEGLVNWSALACQAFEHKLAELIKQRGSKNMTDVVNRLRASKQKLENKQYQDGYAAGREWAKDTAEAQELINLEYNRDQLAEAWDDWWQSPPRPASWRFLACLAKGNYHGSNSDVRSFWEHHGFEEDEPATDFVRGFAEGALSVWSEVKDQL